MVKINNVLKLLFICLSFIFLVSLINSPKTNCQACSLEYDGSTYNGYDAFEFYEDNCISYAKPWDLPILPNLTGEYSE